VRTVDADKTLSLREREKLATASAPTPKTVPLFDARLCWLDEVVVVKPVLEGPRRTAVRGPLLPAKRSTNQCEATGSNLPDNAQAAVQ
jgi:hypothetical protein